MHTTSMPYVDDPWGGTTPWDARIGAVNPLLNYMPAERALPLVPRYLEGTKLWLEAVSKRIKSGPEGEFMGGRTPHHGDFATFAICDNICTLGGSEALSAASPELPRWFASMRELPAVASHLESRPKAGTGAVGKPGSLIYRHGSPADVVHLYHQNG